MLGLLSPSRRERSVDLNSSAAILHADITYRLDHVRIRIRRARLCACREPVCAPRPPNQLSCRVLERLFIAHSGKWIVVRQGRPHQFSLHTHTYVPAYAYQSINQKGNGNGGSGLKSYLLSGCLTVSHSVSLSTVSHSLAHVLSKTKTKNTKQKAPTNNNQSIPQTITIASQTEPSHAKQSWQKTGRQESVPKTNEYTATWFKRHGSVRTCLLFEANNQAVSRTATKVLRVAG